MQKAIAPLVAGIAMCGLAGCQREYISDSDPRFPRHHYSQGFTSSTGNHEKLEALKRISLGNGGTDSQEAGDRRAAR